MEDLIIGLLFLYFFVLRPILKQVRKGDAKAKEAAKVRPPLRGLVDAVRAKMQEIAEEAEAVRREKARRRPGGSPKEWFAEAARGPEVGHRKPSGEDVPPPDWLSEEPWGTVVEPEDHTPDQTAAASLEPEPLPAQPGLPPGETPTRELARPRVDLRQAVVWAEILGAPVSLRDGGWK